MKMSAVVNRRLMLAIATPLARALLSAAAGYLSAKGVPPDMVDQFSHAIGVGGLIAFNVGWELIDRRKAENRGMAKAMELGSVMARA